MSDAPTTLALAHGDVALPAFFPDATHGYVRGLDATDVAASGVQGLVMSVFHLMQRPGTSSLRALGGLHRFSGWEGPIVTDSGGFQAWSLIRQNTRRGRLSDQGLTIYPEGSERKLQLTPEKSIQLQLRYGADVVICLDDCTDVGAPPEEQEVSVRRTIAWAARCKEEFERLLKDRKRDDAPRPLLLGVIQGGGLPELRRACAEALLAIGFDGYGLGGWPLDAQGSLLTEIIAYTRALVPRHLPMHALGVGRPDNILACVAMGYDLFDSAMPTRDARHGRLLVLETDPGPEAFDGDWYSYHYVQDERHLKDPRPVSERCDCLACRRYSRAFLYHLFKTGDTLYTRLATLHNLRFMTLLMERIREAPRG